MKPNFTNWRSSLLTMIFITLKLCGVIAWSWVWVLAPYWISTILMAICILIMDKPRY